MDRTAPSAAPEGPVPPAPEARDAIRVLDLFAGAGGLTAGFHAASGRFHTIAAVEMDPAAAATFRANHGGEVYVGPIQDWLAEGDVPDVDVIVGGPPCQGFSTLGKQNVEDDRNALWREYAHTIVRAQPRYFVVENVAAFARSPQYAQFLEEIQPDGMLRDWTFRSAVLNAADYGAPQARRRAVLIGHHRDLPFPGWPERTHAGRHATVGEALRHVPREPTGIDLPAKRTMVDGKPLPGAFMTAELHLGRDYSDLSLRRFAAIPRGGNRFDLPDELLAPCWRKHRTGSADVMGRLRSDRPSVTIRTEFFKPEKGRYLHPVADRALTHREAAILQGFPEEYRWVGSKTAIARQIGNAVPIPLGRAIGEVLVRHLSKSIERESREIPSVLTEDSRIARLDRRTPWST